MPQYEVISPINHNNKLYEVGSPIELANGQAERLLKNNIIIVNIPKSVEPSDGAQITSSLDGLKQEGDLPEVNEETTLEDLKKVADELEISYNFNIGQPTLLARIQENLGTK